LISSSVLVTLPARRVREVGVARRASVFVRPLSMDEGRKLARITRSAKNPVRLRRAIVVMMAFSQTGSRPLSAFPAEREVGG
jgi:hypothetical protein